VKAHRALPESAGAIRAADARLAALVLPNYPRQLPRPVKRRPWMLRASKSIIRCIMAVLDFIVIGFGSFVAIVALSIVALLAAYRH
jgi:hypothetical protein